VSESFVPRNAGQPLEERVEIQALRLKAFRSFVAGVFTDVCSGRLIQGKKERFVEPSVPVQEGPPSRWLEETKTRYVLPHVERRFERKLRFDHPELAQQWG
jgi:hypothetical protein